MDLVKYIDMTDIRKLIGKVPDINMGNRYEVTLFLPRKLSEYELKVDDITFYCQKCAIPGFSLTQVDSRIYGEKRKLGSIKDSEMNVSTSMLFDYKAANIKFFEAWINLISDPDTKRLNYYNDYIGSMQITLLNNLNDPILDCILEEVYPVKINEISLAYENAELLPIEIEWQYRGKKINKIGPGGRSSGTVTVTPGGN